MFLLSRKVTPQNPLHHDSNIKSEHDRRDITQVYRASIMPPLCLRYASVATLIGLHRLIGHELECIRNQNIPLLQHINRNMKIAEVMFKNIAKKEKWRRSKASP